MHDLVAYTAVELVAHLGDPKFEGSLLLISLILFLLVGGLLLRIALFPVLRGALVTGLLANGLVPLREGLLLRLLRVVLHDHEYEADFVLRGDLVALLEENDLVPVLDLSEFPLPDLHNPISSSSQGMIPSDN
jgi:hypothetical protein